MIDIYHGELKDLWIDETSPEFLALSYVLKVQLARIIVEAAGVGINYDIDGLDEETLDYLAVELRAAYYEQDLPIEKKRTIIKNALLWRSKGGTSGVLKEVIDTIFGSGDLEEWYDNDRPVNTFEVVMGEEAAKDTSRIDKLADIIEQVKNVRSHYAGLTFQGKTKLRLIREDDQAYKLDPPLCGTLPYPAQLGGLDNTALHLRTNGIAGEVPKIHPSDIHMAGTAPTTAELGHADQTGLNLNNNGTSAALAQPAASDTTMTGTTPTAAEIAKLETTRLSHKAAEASGAHPDMRPGENARPRTK